MSALKRPKQRVALADMHKRRLCQIARENPSFNHRRIAKQLADETGLAVERSTVSRVVANAHVWLNSPAGYQQSKRRSKSHYPILEEAVFEFIRVSSVNESSRARLTDARICQFAKLAAQTLKLSDFRCSPAWLAGVKKRRNIPQCKASDDPQTVYDIWQTEQLSSNSETLSNYDRLEDIYVLHATSLYYRAGPEDIDWFSASQYQSQLHDCSRHARETRGNDRIPNLSTMNNRENPLSLHHLMNPSQTLSGDDYNPFPGQTNPVGSCGTLPSLLDIESMDSQHPEHPGMTSLLSGLQSLLGAAGLQAPSSVGDHGSVPGQTNMEPRQAHNVSLAPLQAQFNTRENEEVDPMAYNDAPDTAGDNGCDNTEDHHQPQSESIGSSVDAMTILLCINATASGRVDPWMIGSDTVSGPRDHPDRPFPGVSVMYKCNGKGWLTSSVIRDWLVWFDSTLDHAVLLMTSLATRLDVEGLPLKWVTVLPLVPWAPQRQGDRGVELLDNCSAATRLNDVSRNGPQTPMDSIILEMFRARYRLSTIDRILTRIERGQHIFDLSLREVAEMIWSSWAGVKDTVVKNAFRKSEIIPTTLSQRMKNTGGRSRDPEDSLRQIRDDIMDRIVKYREKVPGYMFAPNLGLRGINFPPEHASPRLFITMGGELCVIHADASEQEIIASVMSPEQYQLSGLNAGANDATRASDESIAGQTAVPSATIVDHNGSAGSHLEHDSQNRAVTCTVQNDDLTASNSPAIAVSSRQETLEALKLIMAFIRTDRELYTEDMIYHMSRMIQVVESLTNSNQS